MLIGARSTVAVVSALVLLAGAASIRAQQEPQFDVASVREAVGTRADGLPYPLSLKVLPNRIDITNASLNQLIVLAFDVPYDRVGWPEELKRRRDEKLFEVRATSPEGATRAQLPAMLRALLTDRFGLVTRVESRSTPVYALIVQTQGHRMKEVAAADELTKEFPTDGTLAQRVVVDSVGTPFVTQSLVRDNSERIIAAMDGIRVVTTRSSYRLNTEGGISTLEAFRMTMPELVRNLASRADRPIIDDTQLAGLYAFVVELPPLNSVLRLIGQMTDRNGKPMDSSPSSASIFKAVERLGLRLEERRAPLDFLVIEQARPAPTAN